MQSIKNLKEKEKEELEKILENTELRLRYYGERLAYIEGKNEDSQIDASDLRDLANGGYNINYIDIRNNKINICIYLPN